MDITYHAVFQYDDDGICIHFPAVPQAITCADSFDEGVYMASDVLGLVLTRPLSQIFPANRSVKSIWKKIRDRFLSQFSWKITTEDCSVTALLSLNELQNRVRNLRTR